MADRQVFIGNLCNVSNEALRTYCETYGQLTELSLNRDKENNVYHCFAFVTFQLARCTSQFMSNRPHYLNGDEVFVKRALPRLIASIPERLIVTNRLIVRDSHKHDKRFLQKYFQKYGHIKNFDIDHGFIDYDDYDDVDRVLLARPHYIHDKEVYVTKFAPSEQSDNSLRQNSNHRIHTNSNHRHHEQQSDRSIVTSTDNIKSSCTTKFEQNPPEITISNHQCHSEEEEEEDDNDCSYLNNRYEQLEGQFQEYKQAKELELCSLRMDFERTKRQLTDVTQEKLDLLLKNQQLFHNQLVHRLFPSATSVHTQTAEDFCLSTPNKLAKKRKLSSSSSSPVDREYEYYS